MGFSCDLSIWYFGSMFLPIDGKNKKNPPTMCVRGARKNHLKDCIYPLRRGLMSFKSLYSVGHHLIYTKLIEWDWIWDLIIIGIGLQLDTLFVINHGDLHRFWHIQCTWNKVLEQCDRPLQRVCMIHDRCVETRVWTYSKTGFYVSALIYLVSNQFDLNRNWKEVVCAQLDSN